MLPPLDPDLEEDCQALVDCGKKEEAEEEEKGGPVHLVGNLKNRNMRIDHDDKYTPYTLEY